MEIVLGKVVKNKTYLYLRPALKFLGPTFVTKFNVLSKLAYGIHDSLLDGSPLENLRTMYIVVDTYFKPPITLDVITWLSNQEYFLTKYPLNSLDDRYIMLCIGFPDKFADIYDKFLEGKYSYMYTYNEIEELFPDVSPAREVLLKSRAARVSFVKIVNEIYNSKVLESDFKGKNVQLDFPPTQEEEYFNYKKSETPPL